MKRVFWQWSWYHHKITSSFIKRQFLSYVVSCCKLIAFDVYNSSVRGLRWPILVTRLFYKKRAHQARDVCTLAWYSNCYLFFNSFPIGKLLHIYCNERILLYEILCIITIKKLGNTSMLYATFNNNKNWSILFLLPNFKELFY